MIKRKKLLILVITSLLILGLAVLFHFIFFDGNISSAENDKTESEIKPGDGSGLEEIEEIYEKEENVVLALNNDGFVFKIPFKEGEIDLEIFDENIIKLENYIDDGSKILTPLSLGETKLKVSAKESKKVTIKIYNIMVVSYDKELEILINGSNEINNLMAGTKADGTYQIYEATVKSCRMLSDSELVVNKSDNIKIVENSLKILKQENGGSWVSFLFYVTEGDAASLQIEVKNNFFNYKEPTICEKAFAARQYVKEINYTISSQGNSPILETDSYVLYSSVPNFEEQMNLDGYYTFYDIQIDKNIFSITSNSSLLKIEETDDGYSIKANQTGIATLTIQAKDGSGVIENLTILIKEVKAERVNLKTEQQELSFSNDEFIAFLKGIGSIEINLENGIKRVVLSKFPIYSTIDFEILPIQGISVSLEIKEDGENYIIDFVAKNKGTSSFIVKFENQEITQFSVNVIEQTYQIKIYEQVSDLNSEIIGDVYETNKTSFNLYLKLFVNNEVDNNIIFNVACENENVIYDKLAYGRVFIKFQEKGEYLFTFTNEEYGITKSLLIVVK